MIDMEEKTKVVIYARVSTSAQDYTRQITELRKYAKKQNFVIVKEFSEKISGGKGGRKEGYRQSEEEYRRNYEREIVLLQKGNTLKDVKSITGTTINTLRKLRE